MRPIGIIWAIRAGKRNYDRLLNAHFSFTQTGCTPSQRTSREQEESHLLRNVRFSVLARIVRISTLGSGINSDATGAGARRIVREDRERSAVAAYRRLTGFRAGSICSSNIGKIQLLPKPTEQAPRPNTPPLL